MSCWRPIQSGDAVMFRSYGDGEPIVGAGVWLAVEDEAEDAVDGLRWVLIERIGGTDRHRARVVDLEVTDTVEERVANMLMKEEGEAR